MCELKKKNYPSRILIFSKEHENIIMKVNQSEDEKDKSKWIFGSSDCFGDSEGSWEFSLGIFL